MMPRGMALKTSADYLWSEVRSAIEHRDSFLGEPYWNAIRRFHGPAYNRNTSTEVDFDNHAYSWISIFLPILASGNPRIKAKTARMGAAATFSKAVEMAVNRNFELTDVKRTIEQLATDWAFRYAVAITTPEPVPGMAEREDPPFRPTTKRLSLEDYIWDPLSKQHAECRFQGHRIIRDREDMLAEAEEHPERGWDRDVIQSIGQEKGRERQRNRLDSQHQRDEVEYWVIWIPEIMLDDAVDDDGNEFQPLGADGYNGSLFAVSEGKFVRSPRPFWGPREGAYTFNGYLYVSDEASPLSPLVATAAQAEIYNAVMESAIENIKTYKRGFGVGSTAGNLAELVADFQDTGILQIDAIEKLTDNLKDVEIGGLTPQHTVQIELLRNLLERNSGISEALQGTTSGATATEASIASMAVGKRMGYMTEKFISGMVKPIAKKEAWYASMHPSSRTELGELAEGLFLDPITGQPIEFPILLGGSEDLDLMESFDCEIEPIAMRFTTEMLEAERNASWEQFVLATAPMIPTTPFIDWGLLYRNKAEQMGNPALARIVDVNKGLMMGQIQMMMQIGQPMPGVQSQQTGSQPRLGLDIGKPKPPQLKTSEKPGGFSSNSRPTAAKSGSANKGPRTPGASASTK